ncbi:MAG: hypothetical protein LH650_15800 [Chloroflexi bacterium]|nr:hypothetical protein [Chloroflexota bacterium]
MADKEPSATDGRLDDVNPGPRPLDDHAQHDRWLIVRVASNDTDLTAAETSSARSLLDSCAACATLAADITTITHATAVSVVPSRPRDFRLTPEQAASARGGFLDRLGRWIASPRGAVLRPLAGASLALGIVLVVVGPSLKGPIQLPVAPPAADMQAPVQSSTPNPYAGDSMPRPEGTPSADGAETATGMAPEPTPDLIMITMMASPGPTDGAGIERVSKESPEATADPELAVVNGVPTATESPADGGQQAVAADASVRASDDTAMALTLLGIVLAGTGLLVLVLTWLVRRTSQDPLLR